jgi:predicted dehydrogenase
LGVLTVAVIGCGAVARRYHLPALAASEKVKVVALVDEFLPRARDLAAEFGVPDATNDYRTVIDAVDAAVVATPNHLHAPIAIDFLHQGVHVLVEKPMATTTRACDEMAAAAERGKAVLAVGLNFRFFEASRFVRALFVDGGVLGRPLSFDLSVGILSKWPSASDFYVRRDAAGGGVLIDWGIHVLDLLLWWLGDYEGVDYYDDALGGVEANCELHLRLAGGAAGMVTLSRVRSLANACTIRAERGEVTLGIWEPDPVIRLSLDPQRVALSGQAADGRGARTWQDTFRLQIDDFAQAVFSHQSPFVSAGEGKRAVSLVEDAYAAKKLLRYSWLPIDPAPRDRIPAPC